VTDRGQDEPGPASSAEQGVRAAGKARTHENLLDAAATVFAERGFGAASVEEIARRAGVSVGSVYAHFQSKQKLFVALMDRRRDQEVAATREHLSGGLEAALDKLDRQLVDAADNHRAALLATEAWLYATRDDSFGADLAEHNARLRQDLVPLVAAERERRGVGWSISDEEVASVVLSMYTGLVQQRRLDADAIPDDLYGRAIMALFRGL
jgi:AcrR family transcriptional regulator